MYVTIACNWKRPSQKGNYVVEFVELPGKHEKSYF